MHQFSKKKEKKKKKSFTPYTYDLSIVFGGTTLIFFAQEQNVFPA